MSLRLSLFDMFLTDSDNNSHAHLKLIYDFALENLTSLACLRILSW